MRRRPPPILPPPGGRVENIVEMILALKAMVARLMKKCVIKDDVHDAERHIKIFLSSFERFDKAIRGKDDKPTWITSYNFICLTNLPDMLRDFGPIRNLWEGGGQGEKIIGLLKPSWFGFRKKKALQLVE